MPKYSPEKRKEIVEDDGSKLKGKEDPITVEKSQIVKAGNEKKDLEQSTDLVVQEKKQIGGVSW